MTVSPPRSHPLATRLAPERGWLDAGRAVLDRAGRIRLLNTPLAAWLGRDRDELIGQPLRTVLASCYPEWGDSLRVLECSTEPFEQVALGAGPPSARQWFSCEITRAEDWTQVRLNSALPPVAELAESPWDEHLGSESARREAFVRMLRAEARLHNLIAHWPGVVFSQRADFSFAFVSPKIEELTGVSAAEWERSPTRFWDVVHEGDTEELRQRARLTARTLQSATGTHRVRNLVTRQIHHVLEHRQAVVTNGGVLLGYEGVWLDVTRQTLAEKRLSGAAWKETLSTITMGMAHDFGNVMAGIHSLSESFCSQIDGQHPFHEGLTLIQRNARQAGQLVQRIIRLHHGKPGERSYQDLNAMVTEVFELVRKVIPRTVEVFLALAPGQLPLYVDPVEFRQVAINLALNAAEAMARGGRLTFASAPVTAMPEAAHWRGHRPRLPAACLSVTDTGHGIAARDLPTIFDPFFTTKAMNKGSGLGLYNAQLFVEKHGGGISVESEPGRGTTFHLWLPAADFTETEPAPAAVPWRQWLLLVGGSPKLVEGSAEVLRLWGFTVSTAAGFTEALDACADAARPPHGIFLLLERPDAGLGSFMDTLSRDVSSARRILQIVGFNQDELESAVLAAADLTITVDTPAESIHRQLRQLFA